jgi:cytoskeletal protein CcmA (bactofilin family)
MPDAPPSGTRAQEPGAAAGADAARAAERPLLEAGAAFEGLLILHGDARIDGRVQGEIIGARCLYVGGSARIEARVQAEEVVVAGSVEGAIEASRRTELLASARVRGSIDTGRLALAEGSLFEGPCRIRGDGPRGEREPHAVAPAGARSS